MMGKTPVMRLELLDVDNINFAEYVMDIHVAEAMCITLGVWLQNTPRDNTAAPTSFKLQ